MIDSMAVANTDPRIKVLSSSLANQLAAGEVVERPASIVKELLENSIDAGATRIQVHVARGGLESLRVTDDGHGIHPDDLRLALERHATSKIRSAGDLGAIRSLGFRGEALPSIASVAALTLTSRQRACDGAWQVENQPRGGQPRLSPASHPPGTTVQVVELFHHVPARRRFLRSESTEFLHILEVARRIALSRSEVSLDVYHGDKRVLHTVACPPDSLDRAVAIFGRSFARGLNAIDVVNGPRRLWGWVGEANRHRSHPDQQLLFLNGRTIRDRQVSHAVRLAYGDTIPAGRYPVYLLYLEVDPEAVDVNVHPTKHEVRFRELRDTHDFIFAATRSGLGQRETNQPPPSTGVPTPVPATGTGGVAESGRNYLPGAAPRVQPPASFGEALAVLRRRFIIGRRGDALLIVDGVRARQMLLARRLHNADTEQAVQRRPLLVPLELQVGTEAAGVMEDLDAALTGAGFVISRIGTDRIRVREFPLALAEFNLGPCIGRLAQALTTLRRPVTTADILAAVPGCVGDDDPEDLDMDAARDLFSRLGEPEGGVHGAELDEICVSMDAVAVLKLLGRHE